MEICDKKIGVIVGQV